MDGRTGKQKACRIVFVRAHLLHGHGREINLQSWRASLLMMSWEGLGPEWWEPPHMSGMHCVRADEESLLCPGETNKETKDGKKRGQG